MKTNIEYFQQSLTSKELTFDRHYFINEIILGDCENELIKSKSRK